MSLVNTHHLTDVFSLWRELSLRQLSYSAALLMLVTVLGVMAPGFMFLTVELCAFVPRAVACFQFSGQPAPLGLLIGGVLSWEFVRCPRGSQPVSSCSFSPALLIQPQVFGEPGKQEGQECWELPTVMPPPCCLCQRSPLSPLLCWVPVALGDNFLPSALLRPVETGPGGLLPGAVGSAAHCDQTHGKFFFLLWEPLVSLEDLLLTLGGHC